MRKKLISAMVLALLLSLMFVGTAFADNAGGGTDNAPCAPAGSHVLGDVPGAPGGDNGNFGDPASGGGIAHNPICPAHGGRC